MVNLKIEISNRVVEILKVNRKIEENDNLKDLGLDSLNTLELIIRIEDIFSITFEDKEFIVDNFNTISKIERMVKNKIDLIDKTDSG